MTTKIELSPSGRYVVEYRRYSYSWAQAGGHKTWNGANDMLRLLPRSEMSPFEFRVIPYELSEFFPKPKDS